MHEWDPNTIFGAQIPFVRFCGIEALDVTEGQTRLRLVLRQDHANNLGIAHGGIICTLLDVAMGTAARLSAGTPVVTLDMQDAFPQSGRPGILEAVGRVTRGDARCCSARPTSRTSRVVTVASATGVLKPVADRATG